MGSGFWLEEMKEFQSECLWTAFLLMLFYSLKQTSLNQITQSKMIIPVTCLICWLDFYLECIDVKVLPNKRWLSHCPAGGSTAPQLWFTHTHTLRLWAMQRKTFYSCRLFWKTLVLINSLIHSNHDVILQLLMPLYGLHSNPSHERPPLWYGNKVASR